MESFWVAVVFLLLATMGAFVTFVVFYWFAAAGEAAEQEEAEARAAASRTAATGRMHHQRGVT